MKELGEEWVVVELEEVDVYVACRDNGCICFHACISWPSISDTNRRRTCLCGESVEVEAPFSDTA